MDSIKLRERLFFYIVFAILIVLMLLMLSPFFTVLIVSLISVIILKPVYNYFLERAWVNKRTGLAASLTLIAILVVLVVPVLIIIWVTANQLSGVFEELATLDLADVIQDIQVALASLPLVGDGQPGGEITAESTGLLFTSVAKAVGDFAVSLASSIPTLMVQGVVFVVVVASLLPVYDVLVPRLEEISPLGIELSHLYNRKITAMVKSLVFGVFLVAIIQGAAMGFFFWLAGLPYIFLFTLLSMALAMIPMVGISWLVIGIAIVSFLTGNWQQGVIVLIGFYGVVNWIDFFLRPKLLSEEASLSFALFLLSIFAGIAWAGVMGLFYGPVIMLLLVTTIQIYAERYAHEDRGLLGEALGGLVQEKQAAPATSEMDQQTPTTMPSESTGQADEASGPPDPPL